MTPELWKAKKIVDSTLHPDTGEPVFLPFRMSCFVLSNLVVTAGMLTPNLSVSLLPSPPPPPSSPLSLTFPLFFPEPRHNSLASSQPIAQRSNQLLQLEQIFPAVLV